LSSSGAAAKILFIPGSVRGARIILRLALAAEATRISPLDYPLWLFDAEMTPEVGLP
jgi:hypothetical protein